VAESSIDVEGATLDTHLLLFVLLLLILLLADFPRLGLDLNGRIMVA
jgi:hypothetical protein